MWQYVLFIVYNGPELLSHEFVDWARSVGMRIQYIQPGKPNQNAFVVRLNNLEEAGERTYWWLIDYNEERSHGSLEDMTPVEFRDKRAGNSSSELSI